MTNPLLKQFEKHLPESLRSRRSAPVTAPLAPSCIPISVQMHWIVQSNIFRIGHEHIGGGKYEVGINNLYVEFGQDRCQKAFVYRGVPYVDFHALLLSKDTDKALLIYIDGKYPREKLSAGQTPTRPHEQSPPKTI